MARITTDSYAPTGTPGPDDILAGGLPTGRLTMLKGPPGAAKTLFSPAFASCTLSEDESDSLDLTRKQRLVDGDPGDSRA